MVIAKAFKYPVSEFGISPQARSAIAPMCHRQGHAILTSREIPTAREVSMTLADLMGMPYRALGRPRAFGDRREAGAALAETLRRQELGDAVVVGLARGGAVVAAELARALRLPLDVLAVRKVGHPLQPEYAIGAVTPRGGTYLRDGNGLIGAEINAAVADAHRRADLLDARLHAEYPPLPLADRTCLLVDDGLATGATMQAAVSWALAGGARRIVVVVPVGARETVAMLQRQVDVVCPVQPQSFGAVGFWYEDFAPVSDDEVVALLAASRRGAPLRREASIPVAAAIELPADVSVPAEPIGWVVFAHGSGSGRRSPRNIQVADLLNEAGVATLLFDLLTHDEELDRANVFDIRLLADRLIAATRWLKGDLGEGKLPIGYFGASTGAAAALVAAADEGAGIAAVVSRGGRPDLAESQLALVPAPTLLIVGGADEIVLDLNRRAAARLRCEHELAVVPGATHLFEERGALEQVARLARDWFLRHFSASDRGPRALEPVQAAPSTDGR
jgi:putative phosphoribosyl transferase